MSSLRGRHRQLSHSLPSQSPHPGRFSGPPSDPSSCSPSDRCHPHIQPAAGQFFLESNWHLSCCSLSFPHISRERGWSCLTAPGFYFRELKPPFILAFWKSIQWHGPNVLCEIMRLRTGGPLQSFWFHLLSDHKSVLTTLLNLVGSVLVYSHSK